MSFLYSRLLIYCSLLAFLLLLSLKWDGYIDADYWLVFSPLWLWKFIAVSSTLAASYIWHRQPHYSFDQESLVEYKSMMMSISLHLLILVYEVLVCDNLETASRSRHLWTLICIPLVALCCLAVVVCIWSVKHDRPFEVSDLWIYQPAKCYRRRLIDLQTWIDDPITGEQGPMSSEITDS